MLNHIRKNEYWDTEEKRIVTDLYPKEVAEGKQDTGNEELKTMTVPQLTELAKEHSIEVPAKIKKQELVNLLADSL